MSGPKSSRYTLSAEQLRRILEEQERIRRELEEKAKKEREYKEAKATIDGIFQNTAHHVAAVKTVEKRARTLTTEFGDTIDDRFSRFYASADKLMSLTSTRTNNHSKLMSARTEAERLFSELVQLKNKLVVDTQDLFAKQAIQDTAAIADAVNVSFADLGAVEEEINQTAVEALEMLQLLTEQNLPVSLHDEVNTAIERLQKLEDRASIENYAAITVASIRKRAKAYEEFCEKYGQQFDALQDRYYGLCLRLGVDPKEYSRTQNDMSELEAEVNRLECRMNHEAEQVYISQSLDEVMREMGYHVIGSRHVTKKSGKSFTSKLLTYDDGTVINVTESSSGQITMEIGNTDEKDRAPDANERVALRKKMEQFCEDFKEIEKRLAERGVVLDSRLVMAPPEEVYAQIINLSDFEMVEEYRQHIGKRQVEGTKTQQSKMRNE